MRSRQNQMLQEVNGIPGVTAVGIINETPLALPIPHKKYW